MTKNSLEKIRERFPSYGDAIHVLKQEYHPSLVGAYKVDRFPTLVIVDQFGEEGGKIVGGETIREHLLGILFTLSSIS